ncbi:MAG: DUF1573 domain-containing protein [Pirellulales bacterium]|nr:DUF1573 domain-containing protein [Pirellulales bacterium]
MKSTCISLVLLLVMAASANSQEWAKKMFSETTHDFKTVARGAKAEYTFTIENKYEEDAHISACFSSCECTTPQIEKRFLKTWEKTELKAVVNTKDYFGQRDTTITVKFDAPFPAEVQVHIHARIRGDVVMQPEQAQFGTVKLGSTLQRQIRISYAGRSDWQILRVESANPALEGEAVQASRAGNQVSYNLLATLKGNAPAGYVNDNLFLITNDRDSRAARIPVPVVAIIASPLTVQPNPLLIGVIKKGEPASKQLVVRSTSSAPTPFRITGVRSDDPRFEIKPTAESKTMHLLPVTFKGSDAPGRITAKLLLETDLPNAQPVELMVNVQITP